MHRFIRSHSYFGSERIDIPFIRYFSFKHKIFKKAQQIEKRGRWKNYCLEH